MNYFILKLLNIKTILLNIKSIIKLEKSKKYINGIFYCKVVNFIDIIKGYLIFEYQGRGKAKR